MNFLLTRFYGNSQVTKGMLTVSSTNFAAYTLEAKDPAHAKTRNKALLALPDGIYRLKLFYCQEGYTLRFMLRGTYHYACFEQGAEPADVASGSIILGTAFDGDFAIKGSEDAMAMFGKFLELLAFQQRFGKNNDDITLTIQHAPDYVYDSVAKKTEASVDLADDDWNVIADNLHVEPSK